MSTAEIWMAVAVVLGAVLAWLLFRGLWVRHQMRRRNRILNGLAREENKDAG